MKREKEKEEGRKKVRREGSKKKGEKRGVERWKGRVRERGEIYEERKEKKRKEGDQ